jgi:hypothetical protein
VAVGFLFLPRLNAVVVLINCLPLCGPDVDPNLFYFTLLCGVGGA